MPVGEVLKLEAGKEMGVNYFLERREIGVINVGGQGIASIRWSRISVKSSRRFIHRKGN